MIVSVMLSLSKLDRVVCQILFWFCLQIRHAGNNGLTQKQNVENSRYTNHKSMDFEDYNSRDTNSLTYHINMVLTYPCETDWPSMLLSYFTAIIGTILMTFVVVRNFLICLAVVKDPLRTLSTPLMFFMVNAALLFMSTWNAFKQVLLALLTHIFRTLAEII